MIFKRIFNSFSNIVFTRLQENNVFIHEKIKLLNTKQDQLLILQGKNAINLLSGKNSGNIKDYEFKVFSQWGEDGIIQFITSKIPNIQKSFIEFGVENYSESNTRFLLMNDNWRGLIIDCMKGFTDYILSQEMAWRYDITPVESFVTKGNINNLFVDNGFEGEIGILSIDIDGNDYWIWNTIDVVNPQIVIVEYNSLFGNFRKITVPYKDDFYRGSFHFTGAVYGASLAALVDLGEKKGYDFVGTNSAGNNAFFVRKDLSSPFVKHNSISGFTLSKFRELRNIDGTLSFLSGKERYKLLKDIPVYDLDAEKEVFISINDSLIK